MAREIRPKVVSIRVTERVYEALEKQSKTLGLSVSLLASHKLEQAINEDPGKGL